MSRRLGISNQLIPICTPAYRIVKYIITWFLYGTIGEHSGTTIPKL